MVIVGMRIRVVLSTMTQIRPFLHHLICKFFFFPSLLDLEPDPEAQDLPDLIARWSFRNKYQNSAENQETTATGGGADFPLSGASSDSLDFLGQ
jgi:hypothetical protein